MNKKYEFTDDDVKKYQSDAWVDAQRDAGDDESDNVIITLAVHYEQERTDKLDNNNGLLYGIYYYDVPKIDVDTDDMFNNDIVLVEWYKTELERNNNLNPKK